MKNLFETISENFEINEADNDIKSLAKKLPSIKYKNYDEAKVTVTSKTLKYDIDVFGGDIEGTIEDLKDFVKDKVNDESMKISIDKKSNAKTRSIKYIISISK